MTALSIVMPVFNKEEYLESTLKEILDSFDHDWELIIVDDGSTDGSDTIICDAVQDHPDKKITVLKQDNRGVSAARNAGLNAAKGEWIWFVDADDVPNMNFAHTVMSQADATKAEVFIGGFHKIKGDENTLIQTPVEGICSIEETADLYVQEQPRTGIFGYLWNKIISMDVIKTNSIQFKPGLTLAEDLDFMLSVYMSSTSVCFVPVLAMDYYVATANSSSEKQINYEDQLSIQMKVKTWFEGINKYNQYKKFIQTNITKYAAFILFYENERNGNVKQKAQQLINNRTVYGELTE